MTEPSTTPVGSKKRLDPLTSTLVVGVLAFAGAVLGSWWTTSIQSGELKLRYLNMAIEILSEKPDGGEEPSDRKMREWAVSLLEDSTPVDLPDGLSASLLDRESIPTRRPLSSIAARAERTNRFPVAAELAVITDEIHHRWPQVYGDPELRVLFDRYIELVSKEARHVAEREMTADPIGDAP